MANLKETEILLRRKGLIPEDIFKAEISSDQSSQKLPEIFDIFDSLENEDIKKIMSATTVANNLTLLGYIPSEELFNLMKENEKVSDIVNAVVMPILEQLKGADVKYNPMYRAFPKEVMEKDLCELYVNAIFHYITNGEFMPKSLEDKRLPFNEKVKYKVLNIGSEKDISAFLSNMLNSPVPFSQQDTEDISVLLENRNIFDYMPDYLVNKENMATLCGIAYNKAKDKKDKVQVIYNFAPQITGVNDVLRIMNVINGDGDATLSKKPAICKISRPERRAYLSLINGCRNSAEDMKINKMQWIRVGEFLHPGEFQKQYPKAYYAFSHMRDSELTKTVKTYNAKMENAIKGNLKELSKFASEKPGAFARNLDRILRDAEDPYKVINIYKENAENIAPLLLWQIHSHFKRRVEEYGQEKLRIFTTKSKDVTRTKVVEDETKEIDIVFYKDILSITENALVNIYKDKPEMGKVYISPEIARCKIPNGTRDASKGSVSMAKGSRLPVSADKNIIRAFLWWTNQKTDKNEYEKRVDIDLSAAMLDKDLHLIDRCSYYSLKSACYTHSGDITNGGKFDGAGVSEFIDIDMKKAKEQNVRYFCFTINNFTGQKFSNLENIRFGYMEREEGQVGEIFEPKTVRQVIKPNAPSTSAIMCMFDIEKKEMIWMDDVGQDIFLGQYRANNLDENWKGTAMACYKALHLEKPDIYDVIRINALARGGEIVYDKDEADIVFALDEGIKPTDLDYFTGNLIPKEVAPEFLPKEEVKEEISEKNEEIEL